MVVVITCLLSHYKLSARSFIGRHGQGRRREDALSSVSAPPSPWDAPGVSPGPGGTQHWVQTEARWDQVVGEVLSPAEGTQSWGVGAGGLSLEPTPCRLWARGSGLGGCRSHGERPFWGPSLIPALLVLALCPQTSP